MQAEKKEINIGEKIIDFIQKNRKAIFIAVFTVLALVAGTIIYISIQNALNKRAIEKIEELAVRFDDLRWYVQDENYTQQVNELFTELENFAKKNKGVPASRAYSFIARIHSAKEDWKACEEAWIKAAETGNKTYLAPIALFNAACALEEQGKTEQAIEYFEKCINHPFEFPAAPRAQFNIGRLQEQMGNKQAAIEAYRAVLIMWPDFPVWQHLARSAILRIEVQ